MHFSFSLKYKLYSIQQITLCACLALSSILIKNIGMTCSKICVLKLTIIRFHLVLFHKTFMKFESEWHTMLKIWFKDTTQLKKCWSVNRIRLFGSLCCSQFWVIFVAFSKRIVTAKLWNRFQFFSFGSSTGVRNE